MSNLFLIQGDDEFEKSESLIKLKSQFNKLDKGQNYLQFDKDNIGLLEQELTTYSFFIEPKFIVVNLPPSPKKDDEESNSKPKQDWFSETLEEALLNKVEDVVVCFISQDSAKGKFLKFAEKNCKIIDCNKKKPNELALWTIDNAKNIGISISRIEASYLVEVCGNNKQLINNELIKLRDYISNNAITKNDIDKMCIRTPEIIIFDLTDCIGDKNTKKSLEILEELLDNKEPIQKILVMITRHFKSLLIAKVCKIQGVNVEKELGVKPFAATKYSRQAQNFTLDELVNKFKALALLDVNSKIGNIDIKIGLQQFLLSN